MSIQHTLMEPVCLRSILINTHTFRARLFTLVNGMMNSGLVPLRVRREETPDANHNITLGWPRRL